MKIGTILGTCILIISISFVILPYTNIQYLDINLHSGEVETFTEAIWFINFVLLFCCFGMLTWYSYIEYNHQISCFCDKIYELLRHDVKLTPSQKDNDLNTDTHFDKTIKQDIKSEFNIIIK
ncbi:MAG: hypothetical protein KAS32_28415 [Candidatus Peribacteraceae bacterium]|nr:hypothetical protein [Candidatus Peribacteraceae bacterium]